MVDIHSHILPEVDDGARNIGEAVEMCRLSARDGVRVMVATPHAHDGLHRTHEPAHLHKKVDELNGLLAGRPRIVLGCELRFTHASVNHICGDKSAPTIAGGPYALIEFPHTVIPVGSGRVMFELMSNDIRPVVAHPERNQLLMSEPERFYELVEMGVLGQLDAGSILGKFGKKVEETARVMLEHGLVHIIASDCHNTRNRLPGLSSAVAAVAEVVGNELADAMANVNPAAVVDGGAVPVRPEPAYPAKKRKKWLLFGKS